MNLATPAFDTTPWSDARRILAVRLDNIGDVLMTTPALRALRGSRRAVSLTLLTSPTAAALTPFLREVDDWLTWPAPWLPDPATAMPALPDDMQVLVGQLRRRAFDAAVIFTVYSQSALPAALLCWLAGIPLRLAHARENPYRLLSHWLPDPEPHEMLRHEVRRQLDLVASAGYATDDEGLGFALRDGDRSAALAKLRAAGLDPRRRWLVMHPGASAPARRYPAGHFARLGDLLAETPDLQLVLTGGADEVALVEGIRAACGRAPMTLAGDLSLGELAAVIEGATLLIANNTGPVHLAAALGTPVVDIYALTNPQHGPWRVPHRLLYHDVPCRFCYRSVCPQQHHACLRLLAPERVAQAAHELLALGAERSITRWPAGARTEP